MANELRSSLEAIRSEKGYEGIAAAAEKGLHVFVRDADSARRGLQYLILATEVPETHGGLIIRLN